jgi:hypothetical protein
MQRAGEPASGPGDYNPAVAELGRAARAVLLGILLGSALAAGARRRGLRP